MWRVVVFLNTYTKFWGKIATLLWRKGEEDFFSPKLRIRIEDNNNNSPHDKFHRFLPPFSSTLSDLNFTSYVLYIHPCYVTRHTHSEPGLPMIRTAHFRALWLADPAGGGELPHMGHIGTCRRYLPRACRLFSDFAGRLFIAL